MSTNDDDDDDDLYNACYDGRLEDVNRILEEKDVDVDVNETVPRSLHFWFSSFFCWNSLVGMIVMNICVVSRCLCDFLLLRSTESSPKRTVWFWLCVPMCVGVDDVQVNLHGIVYRTGNNYYL